MFHSRLSNPEDTQKKALESLEITFVFIDESNKLKYIKTVLSWLKSDYHKKEKPQQHFWHNREIIEKYFNNSNAMVGLNKQGEFISYMIWGFYNNGIGAEIEIVEVKEEYQKQGIFKKMLLTYSEKFSNIVVLSAFVLQQSEEAFRKAGFEKHEKKHSKIIRPCVPALNTLPNGQVIATCSEIFYRVKNNPEQYKDSMKYFQIQLDNNGRLLIPIVTAYNYEHYIGIYLNKKLITEGKAKHLFHYEDMSNCFELLTLARIRAENPELFKDFLSLGNPLLTFSSTAHTHTTTLLKPGEDSLSEKKRTKSEGVKAKRR